MSSFHLVVAVATALALWALAFSLVKPAAGTLGLNFIYTTLTQGGADAFVQNQISLPQQDGFALDLREVLIEWPRIGAAAAENFELAMTRKSFAAMPTILEAALIWKRKILVDFTTSGVYIFKDGIDLIQFATKQHLLVEANTYLQLDSNASSFTNIVRVRLGYDIVKISGLDRANLIATSLAT